MREIQLFGHLADLFGEVFYLDVKSPREAAQALCMIVPGFERAFVGTDGQQGYRVQSGPHDLNSVQECELIGEDVIRFIPVIGGAGFGEFFQIITGITLIAAGVLLQAVPGGQIIGQALIAAGVSMTIGGVVQLLAPTPDAQQPSDAGEANYVFDGALNLSAEGNPVPVLLGEGFVGSVVISAGIVADQVGRSQPDSGAPDT